MLGLELECQNLQFFTARGVSWFRGPGRQRFYQTPNLMGCRGGFMPGRTRCHTWPRLAGSVAWHNEHSDFSKFQPGGPKNGTKMPIDRTVRPIALASLCPAADLPNPWQLQLVTDTRHAYPRPWLMGGRDMTTVLKRCMPPPKNVKFCHLLMRFSAGATIRAPELPVHAPLLNSVE